MTAGTRRANGAPPHQEVVSVTVYLVWASELPDELTGPWSEVRNLAPGLAVVASPETLSVVYHQVKWQLAPGVALLVTPVDRRPKSRGLAPGTTSWLRRRLPLAR